MPGGCVFSVVFSYFQSRVIDGVGLAEFCRFPAVARHYSESLGQELVRTIPQKGCDPP